MFTYKLRDGLELRLLVHRDAEEYFNLIDANREHLRRWLPWADRCKTVDDSLNLIKEALHRLADTGGFDAGLWYEGRLAGVIGLWVSRGTQTAEIGYWIGEEFLGKGLVTISCKAALRHAFNDLDMNRIELVTAAENEPSRALADRLGFQYEGTRREAAVLPSGRADLALYSLLRSEWKDST